MSGARPSYVPGAPPDGARTFAKAPATLLWSDLPPELLVLLLKLIAFDWQRGAIYASAATLAGEHEWERTTRKKLDRLAAIGLIALNERPGRAPLIVVLYERLSALDTPASERRGMTEEPRCSSAGNPGAPAQEPRRSNAGDPGAPTPTTQRREGTQSEHTQSARTGEASPASAPTTAPQGVCVGQAGPAGGEEEEDATAPPPAAPPAAAQPPATSASSADFVELFRLAERLELPANEASAAAVDLGPAVALDALQAAVQHAERRGADSPPALARAALRGRWKPSTPIRRENGFDRLLRELREDGDDLNPAAFSGGAGAPPPPERIDVVVEPDGAAPGRSPRGTRNRPSWQARGADEGGGAAAPPFRDPDEEGPSDDCRAAQCTGVWHTVLGPDGKSRGVESCPRRPRS